MKPNEICVKIAARTVLSELLSRMPFWFIWVPRFVGRKTSFFAVKISNTAMTSFFRQMMSSVIFCCVTVRRCLAKSMRSLDLAGLQWLYTFVASFSVFSNELVQHLKACVNNDTASLDWKCPLPSWHWNQSIMHTAEWCRVTHCWSQCMVGLCHQIEHAFADW